MKTVIALILLTAFPAFARLGETPMEIEKRYGPPANPLPVSSTNAMGFAITNYAFKTYIVTVYFWQGKSVKEDVQGKPTRNLSDQECDLLVTEIAAQFEPKRERDAPLWVGKHGEFEATHLGGVGLQVESSVYKKRRSDWLLEQEQAAKKKSEEATKGF